jgi:FkbM family methyltransferase
MPMVSYAQNREDVLLARLFPGAGPGFYIDVGANDPVTHSVTKHFYEKGWRGINLDPHPACFARLQQDRPRDLNLQAGVSDRDGTLAFFEAEESGWSTFSTLQAANLRSSGMRLVERSVPVLTLAAVCERHVPPGQAIDFLKVDAESHEREVLAGADWSRWRPRAVLVEANGFEAWEPILLAAGYLFAAHDGVNRFYVRAEDAALRDLLAVPANVTDEFVPFEYQREIDRLRAELDALGGVGPNALAVARRLQRLASRHPLAASAFRRIFRRAV